METLEKGVKYFKVINKDIIMTSLNLLGCLHC